MLIIEDIDRTQNIDVFNIDNFTWIFYSFIICDHKNRNCSDNDKILYLVKK